MPRFSKDELMDFSQKMIAVCDNLGVSYPDDFKDKLMNSDYVKRTMKINGCDNLESLLNKFTIRFIENPDGNGAIHRIICDTARFILRCEYTFFDNLIG